MVLAHLSFSDVLLLSKVPKSWKFRPQMCRIGLKCAESASNVQNLSTFEAEIFYFVMSSESWLIIGYWSVQDFWEWGREGFAHLRLILCTFEANSHIWGREGKRTQIDQMCHKSSISCLSLHFMFLAPPPSPKFLDPLPNWPYISHFFHIHICHKDHVVLYHNHVNRNKNDLPLEDTRIWEQLTSHQQILWLKCVWRNTWRK